jgi:hypothetical protein
MTEKLKQLLPTWLLQAVERWFAPELATIVLVTSLVLLLGSAAAVPWFARHLPADYLVASRRSRLAAGGHHPYRLLLRLAKNLLGAVLLCCGVAMLVLPGQGLLTMALGLVLLDLPGKRKIIRAFLGYTLVFKAFNHLRIRSGLPPLARPVKAPSEAR